MIKEIYVCDSKHETDEKFVVSFSKVPVALSGVKKGNSFHLLCLEEATVYIFSS